jgi:hypothetical protein
MNKEKFENVFITVNTNTKTEMKNTVSVGYTHSMRTVTHVCVLKHVPTTHAYVSLRVEL